MKCKICTSSTELIFSAELMNKYQVSYFYCKNCGFLSTEEPYWLDEVYSSPISKFDTGHIQRNINISEKLTILTAVFFNGNNNFVDYAGGNGILVRMMRDIGLNYFWEDKYATNLFASGFELNKNVVEKVEAVSVIECFEHFVEPLKEIEKMLLISKNIIFTTELLPAPLPTPNEWWYYTLKRGGHISFFSEKTLKYIANKYELHYFHLGGMHILTENKNISNFKLNILKFTKLGLHNILAKKYKSKTWDDYQYMIKKSENNNG